MTSPRTTSAPPAAVDPEVARARRLLLGLYVLLGVTVASWLSRLPTVQASLDLSTGELGRILLVGAVGSLATVVSAGAIASRWGSRRTLFVASVVYSFSTLLLGLGPTLGSVPVLLLGVLLMSSSFALGNVPMNVESVVIERRVGRTIVPQFHAGFSVGSVLGSGLGALAAWAQLPLLVHFGAIALVTLVWRLRAIPGAILPAPPSPVAAVQMHDVAPARRGAGLREALGAWRERRTLLIGVVVMSAALSEGSANNWVAIAVVEGFAQSEALAAVVFGVFVASMTAARLLGTFVIDRWGRVVVLAASGMVSFAGLMIFGLSPSLPLAVLGVACWGLGAGLAVPIGMAAVSVDPLRAAGRVAVVSAFASVSAITAPPLLGLLAESVGTRQALLVIGIAMLVSTALAGSVREDGQARGQRRPAPAPEPEGTAVDAAAGGGLPDVPAGQEPGLPAAVR